MRYLLFVFWLTCSSLLPTHAAEPHILTLDWTLAETLTALGHPPAGVAQIADYHNWLGEPRLPDSIVDLGLRNQPSMELMAAIKPDLLLITPMFASMAERLADVGPVRTLTLYDPATDGWQTLEDMTRALGILTRREAVAEALIAETSAVLARAGNSVPHDNAILVIQFADDRHVRVYAGNSLYQLVLDRMGLKNAWTGPVNDWGYRLVGLHELADLQGRIVIIQPTPLGTLQRLEQNMLWRHLPLTSQQAPVVLPPVWSLGGLPSAKRFARLLTDVLQKP